jgi:hypothetical protein
MYALGQLEFVPPPLAAVEVLNAETAFEDTVVACVMLTVEMA